MQFPLRSLVSDGKFIYASGDYINIIGGTGGIDGIKNIDGKTVLMVLTVLIVLTVLMVLTSTAHK